MKRMVCFVSVILLTLPAAGIAVNQSGNNPMQALLNASQAKNEVAFFTLGFSGVVIRTGEKTIIIDPAGLLKSEELAALKGKSVDLLLYTHGHSDHFTRGGAKALLEAGNPPVIASPSVAASLVGVVPKEKLISAESGRRYNLGNIIVDAVEGIHFGPITLYRISVGDVTIFHAGDSGYVPLHDYSSDLAFLPTGNPSPSASPENALKMASDIKPGIVVVFHGAASQNEEFRNLMKKDYPRVKVYAPAPREVITLNLRKIP